MQRAYNDLDDIYNSNRTESTPTILVDDSKTSTEPYTNIESWNYKANVYAYAYYVPIKMIIQFYNSFHIFRKNKRYVLPTVL